MIKILLLIVVTCAFLLSCLLIYIYWKLSQRTDVHSEPYEDTPEQRHLTYKTIKFKSLDGTPLVGWYMSVKKPKATVILIHGYAYPKGGKTLMLRHVEYLTKEGYSCFLLDLRANGESGGDKVTFGVDEWKDAKAAYDIIAAQPETGNGKIGFFGISMGAATAITTVGKTGVGDFVIASVPFASVVSMLSYQQEAKLITPLLGLVARWKFGPEYMTNAPINQVGNIHVPILIFTATQDTRVNPKDEDLLFERANEPKDHWRAAAGHDIHKALSAEFETHVLEFLKHIS